MSDAALHSTGDRAYSDVWARVATERALATVAIGLVALHFADDNFLQPQPGTSAGDHLVSGLVPLTVLVLAGWAYPRMRAGSRAPIALALGGFGIVAGVEAVYYTTKGGPSGDDFTGFLSMAAGIVLVGLGVVALWKSRRTNDRLVRRYLRRFLLAVAAVVFAYVVLAPLYISYVHTRCAGLRARSRVGDRA